MRARAKNMKQLKNDTASFYYTEALLPHIKKFCRLSQEYPFLFEPVRGINEKAKEVFSKEGFDLISTVKKTTLLYNQEADSFFKVLHPLTLKKKILFNISDSAARLYSISESLLKQGVKVPQVAAYGNFKKGPRPFIVMKRVEGRSLHHILIRENETLPIEIYQKVMVAVARFHNAGYWFGDSHIDHIFIKDGEVSGFIDIDSIKKKKCQCIKSYAKDMAGLNHYRLPLSEDEKKDLLAYYLKLSGNNDHDEFCRLTKKYSERRWRGRMNKTSDI